MSAVCVVELCERQTSRESARGMCAMHYQRWRNTGRGGEAGPRRTPQAGNCLVEGCERAARSRGMCKTHWARWKRNGDAAVVHKRGPKPGTPGHPQKSGSANHAWVGDRPAYSTAHDRVRHARGSASSQPCRHCGAQAREWAYDHLDPNQLVDNEGKPFSADLDHYMPLCKRCHAIFDGRQP